MRGLPHLSWTLISTAPSYINDSIGILPNLLNLAFYIWTSDAAYLRTQAGRLWQKITHR